MLNLFNVGNRFMLVDMPGYGYKSRIEFGNLVLDYLKYYSHNKLKKLYLLIDSRRGFKELDKVIIQNLIDYGIKSQIVLTKCDKLLKYETKLDNIIKYLSNKHIDLIEYLLNNATNFDCKIILSSIKKDIGVNSLKYQIIKDCDIKDTKIEFNHCKPKLDDIKGPKIY